MAAPRFGFRGQMDAPSGFPDMDEGDDAAVRSLRLQGSQVPAILLEHGSASGGGRAPLAGPQPGQLPRSGQPAFFQPRTRLGVFAPRLPSGVRPHAGASMVSLSRWRRQVVVPALLYQAQRHGAGASSASLWSVPQGVSDSVDESIASGSGGGRLGGVVTEGDDDDDNGDPLDSRRGADHGDGESGSADDATGGGGATVPTAEREPPDGAHDGVGDEAAAATSDVTPQRAAHDAERAEHSGANGGAPSTPGASTTSRWAGGRFPARHGNAMALLPPTACGWGAADAAAVQHVVERYVPAGAVRRPQRRKKPSYFRHGASGSLRFGADAYQSLRYARQAPVTLGPGGRPATVGRLSASLVSLAGGRPTSPLSTAPALTGYTGMGRPGTAPQRPHASTTGSFVHPFSDAATTRAPDHSASLQARALSSPGASRGLLDASIGGFVPDASVASRRGQQLGSTSRYDDGASVGVLDGDGPSPRRAPAETPKEDGNSLQGKDFGEGQPGAAAGAATSGSEAPQESAMATPTDSAADGSAGAAPLEAALPSPATTGAAVAAQGSSSTIPLGPDSPPAASPTDTSAAAGAFAYQSSLLSAGETLQPPQQLLRQQKVEFVQQQLERRRAEAKAERARARAVIAARRQYDAAASQQRVRAAKQKATVHKQTAGALSAARTRARARALAQAQASHEQGLSVAQQREAEQVKRQRLVIRQQREAARRRAQESKAQLAARMKGGGGRQRSPSPTRSVRSAALDDGSELAANLSLEATSSSLFEASLIQPSALPSSIPRGRVMHGTPTRRTLSNPLTPRTAERNDALLASQSRAFLIDAPQHYGSAGDADAAPLPAPLPLSPGASSRRPRAEDSPTAGGGVSARVPSSPTTHSDAGDESQSPQRRPATTNYSVLLEQSTQQGWPQGDDAPAVALPAGPTALQLTDGRNDNDNGKGARAARLLPVGTPRGSFDIPAAADDATR